MADYIDREPIIKNCIKWGENAPNQYIRDRNEDMIKILQNEPTADVVERSKIDKAIEEMESIEAVMFCDEMRDLCVEILKRNIGA